MVMIWIIKSWDIIKQLIWMIIRIENKNKVQLDNLDNIDKWFKLLLFLSNLEIIFKSIISFDLIIHINIPLIIHNLIIIVII